MSSLDLYGVRKTFGKAVALDEVSFGVEDGEFFCLLGPSGAGKTTTLKVLAGLEEPNSGTVHLDESDITHVEPTRRNLAMCFESYALYPQLNVFENLASPLRSPLHRVDDVRARVERVAELLTIGHLLDRPIQQLSNGQRQRVALGRVLIRPASAYLLDEPLSHLDAKLRATMRAELKAISRDDGTTTLYVTHDYVEALSLADRIGVLDNGRIRQIGTPREIWAEPADTVVAQLFGKPRINLIEGSLAATGFVSKDKAVKVPVPGVEAGARALLGVRPRDLGMHRGAGDIPDGLVRLDGTVYVLEHLGRQTEVTVKVGESLIAVVVPRSAADGLVIDDKLALTLDPAVAHVFLPDEGGRRATR
ncbi:ABC transporter ATP-binding protein [Flindersiella endophytica]